MPKGQVSSCVCLLLSIVDLVFFFNFLARLQLQVVSITKNV